MPPHCGAIYWVRLLYYKLKRPILRFQKVEEMMNSPLKEETFRSYLNFAKELKAYEQSNTLSIINYNKLYMFGKITGKLDDFLEQYAPIMEKGMQMDILKLSPINRKSTFYKVSRVAQSTISTGVSIQSKSKSRFSLSLL